MATAKPITTKTSHLYEDDFYDWTQDQAQALRGLAAQGWDGPLDLANLAEEVEDLGRAERNAVESQTIRILEHLLKLAHSPSSAPRLGWQRSITDARNAIEQRLTRSIERQVRPKLAMLYEKARYNEELDLKMHGEHDAAASLPEACPFSWGHVCRARWYPQPVTPPAAPPGT